MPKSENCVVYSIEKYLCTVFCSLKFRGLNDMLESRNSYGYGYIGHSNGFDWEFIPNEFNAGGCGYHQRLQGGYVFPDAETAIKAGMKWLRKYNNGKYAQKYGLRHGTIIAIKNHRVFEY